MNLGVVEHAALLRERSIHGPAKLHRPLTLAESLVAALIARGASYEETARQYGAHPSTVATLARYAADKILDGVAVDPELERLKPKLRIFVWARRTTE